MKIICILFFIQSISYALSESDINHIEYMLSPATDIGSNTVAPSSQLDKISNIKSGNYNLISQLNYVLNQLIDAEKIASHLQYLKMLKIALEKSIKVGNLQPFKDELQVVKTLVMIN